MTTTRSPVQPPSTDGLPPVRALAAAEVYLRDQGVDSPRRTAEILLMHVFRVDRASLYVRREALTPTEAGLLSRVLSERRSGVPLQYVVGHQQFMDLDLQVRPGVFVPRPETERLVEAALEVLSEGPPHPLVIDVGTGTGAIALAIKRFFPMARVIGTDVSTAAVDLARTNANQLRLNIEVLHGDLLDPVPAELRGRVDLLVSNPPYVTAAEYESVSDEVRAEPYEALVGGIEFHQRLVDAAVEWLAPGGWLMTEIGADQGEEVRRLFGKRLNSVEVLTDLAGRDRIVRGHLYAVVLG